MKIKIPRALLLEKIERYVKGIELRMEMEQSEYEAKVEPFRAKLAARLREAGEAWPDAEEDWEEVSWGRERGEFSIKVEFDIDPEEIPVKPVEPSDLWKARRDMEALRLSTQNELSIGPEDHLWRYLDRPQER